MGRRERGRSLPAWLVEEGSNEARAAYLAGNADEAAALHAKELQRRERKVSKAGNDEAEDDAPRHPTKTSRRRRVRTNEDAHSHGKRSPICLE